MGGTHGSSHRAGNITFKALAHPVSISGVGSGQVCATQAAEIPIRVNGHQERFTAPMVPDSELPAILGHKSLAFLNGIVDTGAQKLVIPGPGGYQVTLSPGSQIINLERTDSGHVLMPVTDSGAARPRNTEWTAYGHRVNVPPPPAPHPVRRPCTSYSTDSRKQLSITDPSIRAS